MPFLQLEKTKLYYEVHGEGEPILCISGLGSDHNEWGFIVPILDKCYQLITFDNLLVGQTKTKLKDIDIDVLADTVFQLLKYLDIPSAHVWGQSMGGMIASKFCSKYPEHTKSLILQATFIKLTPYANEFVNNVLALYETKTSTALKVEILLSLVFCYATYQNIPLMKTIREGFLIGLNSMDLERYKRQAAVCLNLNTESFINSITANTLIISAEMDNISSPEEAQKIKSKIAKSKVITIKRAAHGALIEQPEQICEAVNTFLTAICS